MKSNKKKVLQSSAGDQSRRKFLKGSALAAAGFAIVPRHVLGMGYKAPSDTLNIAGVGVAGMGRSNLEKLAGENIVALCDVDDNYVQKKGIRETYSKAKYYHDFRVMLEEMKDDIDAVVVATPDHTHAVVATMAMKMGKHVYVQKPLTYTIKEARVLAELEKETGVICQMGNQGHSSDDARKINEWIWDGAIGDVREVHIWTNRPIWPQGIPFPEDKPPVPDHLKWDLFLGPAPERAYNPAYTPFKWRGWVDYGVGALGDMGAHLVDHPNWALKLGAPNTVHAVSTKFNGESYPSGCVVTYEFGSRENMPPVKLTWYDGGLMPERPEELAEGEKLNTTGGVIMVGDRGKLMHETYGRNPRLLPKAAMDNFKQPDPYLPRIEVSHEMNWANACKGEGEPTSPFSYAGPLTETMLVGMVALRAPGETVKWDSKNMKFPNKPELDEFVHREYREGWELGA